MFVVPRDVQIATSFPLTENPIAEGGKWIGGATVGLDWSDVKTTPGYAGGTIVNPSPPFNDAVALLSGTWGADQQASAHVKNTTKQAGFNQEVAFRLRSSLAPHRCDGYEVGFRCFDGAGWYAFVVRWNGPLNDFDELLHQTTGPGIFTGDFLSAAAIGPVLSGSINGVVAVTWDTTSDAGPVSAAGPARYLSGRPGMGFFQHGQTTATLPDFGFTDFAARNR